MLRTCAVVCGGKEIFPQCSLVSFLFLSHKSSFQWLAFRELVPLCPQRPSFLEHYIDSAVLIAVMDQGQVHKSRLQKWPVGKLNGFSFKWLLAVSFNKGMLCSRCPFELGPIVSLLWGTYWKCPSQDLWGWGWRMTVFPLLQGLCLKPARLEQQAKPQNSSVLPSFPLQQGKAERGWNLKRCACRKICHSFVQEGCVEDTGESLMSYKLLHLFWHWHLGSLYPPSVFSNTSWAKGVCPSCLSYGLCPKDRLGFFVSLVQYLHFLLSPDTVAGLLCLLGVIPSVQRKRWGWRKVPCPTSCVQIGDLWCWLLLGCLLQPDHKCFLHLWKWKRILVSANLLLITVYPVALF